MEQRLKGDKDSKSQDSKEALLELYEKAIAINPDNPNTIDKHGLILYALKRYE